MEMESQPCNFLIQLLVYDQFVGELILALLKCLRWDFLFPFFCAPPLAFLPPPVLLLALSSKSLLVFSLHHGMQKIGYIIQLFLLAPEIICGLLTEVGIYKN